MILHVVDRYINDTIGQFSHFILLRHCPKLLLFSDNTAFFTAGRHVRRRRRELRGQLAETVMYNSGREFVDSLLTGVIVRDVIASQICLSVCSDCRYFCIPLRSCRNAPRQRFYSFFFFSLSLSLNIRSFIFTFFIKMNGFRTIYITAQATLRFYSIRIQAKSRLVVID